MHNLEYYGKAAEQESLVKVRRDIINCGMRGTVREKNREREREGRGTVRGRGRGILHPCNKQQVEENSSRSKGARNEMENVCVETLVKYTTTHTEKTRTDQGAIAWPRLA